MSTLPIILDTDIGDDIDDALALAVILNSPEFELRGVTTVFRDAPRRAQLTEYLLHFWNRDDVPVEVGSSRPLLQVFNPKLGKQFEILEYSNDTAPSQHIETATSFLWHAIAGEGTKPTIVPIGPLTNIALLLARAPEVAKHIRIVLMGGMWNREAKNFKAEWNILCDPEAAEIVFRSGAEIKIIGLDVTLQCVLREEHVQQIANHDSPRSKVLARLIELWMSETNRPPTLHDPLAVLTLFSDCVRFEPMNIGVELCGEERGQMRVLDGAPNAEVAVAVDAARAIDLFMQRVLA